MREKMVNNLELKIVLTMHIILKRNIFYLETSFNWKLFTYTFKLGYDVGRQLPQTWHIENIINKKKRKLFFSSNIHYNLMCSCLNKYITDFVFWHSSSVLLQIATVGIPS